MTNMKSELMDAADPGPAAGGVVAEGSKPAETPPPAPVVLQRFFVNPQTRQIMERVEGQADQAYLPILTPPSMNAMVCGKLNELNEEWVAKKGK